MTEPIMVEQFRKEMQQVKSDLHEVKGMVDKMFNALMGNEFLADGGLIGNVRQVTAQYKTLEQRLDALEKQNTKFEIYQRIVWSSLGGVAMAILAFVLQLVFHK